MKKISLLLLLLSLLFFTSCETLAYLFGFGGVSEQDAEQSRIVRKPVIAVTTFEAKDIELSDTEFLMNMFTVAFVRLKVANVVDRKHFDKIKEEHSFQISDWSDKNKVAELGASLGASHLVVGHIFKRGANLFLDVKILNVNTTEIVASHLDKVESIDDFFEKMPEFCTQLVESATKGVFVFKKVRPEANDNSAKIENTGESFSSSNSDISKKSEDSFKNTKVSASVSSVKNEYKIGDTGPGGVLVFYVDKAQVLMYDGMGGKDLCHYLDSEQKKLPWA